MRLDLLEADVTGIQAFLDEFDPPANGETRFAEINDSGELVIVTNFPLPDDGGFRPDYIDLLLLVDRYPARPPIGIYVLERNNQPLIAQLRRLFSVMGQAVHDAETVAGYQWICVHYEGNNWRYHPRDLAHGDNLRKFLIHFYNRLQSERP